MNYFYYPLLIVILFFAVTKACCGKNLSYKLREAEYTEFEEILMSTTMGSDHLPDVYFYEIKRLLTERLQHMTV